MSPIFIVSVKVKIKNSLTHNYLGYRFSLPISPVAVCLIILFNFKFEKIDLEIDIFLEYFIHCSTYIIILVKL